MLVDGAIAAKWRGDTRSTEGASVVVGAAATAVDMSAAGQKGRPMGVSHKARPSSLGTKASRCDSSSLVVVVVLWHRTGAAIGPAATTRPERPRSDRRGALSHSTAGCYGGGGCRCVVAGFVVAIVWAVRARAWTGNYRETAAETRRETKATNSSATPTELQGYHKADEGIGFHTAPLLGHAHDSFWQLCTPFVVRLLHNRPRTRLLRDDRQQGLMFQRLHARLLQ